jgi:hypothetical protein
VIDRFELILQIFALRAKTPIAKAQLSLAYLDFIKARVGREGGIALNSFNSLKKINIFEYDFPFIFFSVIFRKWRLPLRGSEVVE